MGTCSTQRIMIVAAHPDDEILGCGGAIAKHIARGDRVKAVFMTNGVGARGDDSEIRDAQERRDQARVIAKLMEMDDPVFNSFPDNAMDTIALLGIVKTVEEQILLFKPNTIYTHWQGDLNVDHQLTSRAVCTAARPLPGSAVKNIFAFEVLSSTEWSLSSSAFQPNYFIDITDFWKQKKTALSHYESEIPLSPHARSLDSIESLAKVRGMSVGFEKAEAFQVIRMIDT